MNHLSKTYRQQVLTKIWAFLLLILFTNALLIQALHHHDQDASDLCKTKSEQVQSSSQFKVSKVNCKLCEVLKHQSHVYTLPTACETAFKLAKPADNQVGYLGKHPVAYILSAANKGPPSPIA
ncbi:hypothetical protein ACFSOV_16160 [Pedobacter petrophilus]|uniref:hypothetical protein n=1 Tax=Pedobacter petrophilus TaxID=1908241 RepID=UPI003637E303